MFFSISLHLNPLGFLRTQSQGLLPWEDFFGLTPAELRLLGCPLPWPQPEHGSCSVAIVSSLIFPQNKAENSSGQRPCLIPLCPQHPAARAGLSIMCGSLSIDQIDGWMGGYMDTWMVHEWLYGWINGWLFLYFFYKIITWDSLKSQAKRDLQVYL